MTTTNRLDPEELVKQQYPDAYEDDDGDRIYIRVKETVIENCPTCYQKWTHKVERYKTVLASGGTSSRAWENAAKDLGLI